MARLRRGVECVFGFPCPFSPCYLFLGRDLLVTFRLDSQACLALRYFMEDGWIGEWHGGGRAEEDDMNEMRCLSTEVHLPKHTLTFFFFLLSSWKE